MNLIEAWKKAKDWQNIKNGNILFTKSGNFYDFICACAKEWTSDSFLLSDNWEIEPIKHKEESFFKKTSIDHSWNDFIDPIIFDKIPFCALVKLTYEWEE